VGCVESVWAILVAYATMQAKDTAELLSFLDSGEVRTVREGNENAYGIRSHKRSLKKGTYQSQVSILGPVCYGLTTLPLLHSNSAIIRCS
jgi:hypothetical protein